MLRGVQNARWFHSARVRVLLVWAVIGALAALVLWPAVRTGQWAYTHEKARYALLFEQFRSAVQRGHIYPRWLPDLYGGYGYPNFCFYQPGFFYAALPFSALATRPPVWLYATLWTILSVAGAGAYLLARQVARRLRATPETATATGLFGAALFLLTPYLWVDLYVRGDLSELMALCLTPWPLFALLRLADRLARGLPALGTVLLAGASLAAIVFSHPMVAMFALPTFAMLAVALGGTGAWRQLYPRAALALGMGLLISSVYWYPLATLRSQVGMDRATQGFYEAQKHIVYPWQLLSNAWGFGGSAPGDKDEMSFQLGLVHVVLATAGLVLGRKEKAIRVAYGLYLALALMMTAVGLPLWKHVDLFKLVQFPWRLLAVTAVLPVLCAAGLAAAAKRLSDRTYAAGLVLLLVVGAVWHREQFRIEKPIDLGHWAQEQRREGVRSRMINYSAENEFLPRTAPLRSGLRPRGNNEPILMQAPPAPATPLPDDDEFVIHRRIQASAPTVITLNQLHFPGWRVEVDGVPLSGNELRHGVDGEGRMTVALPPGVFTLRAAYDGPPGWRWRAAIELIGLVLFGVAWRREAASARRARSGPSAA
jgi:hypothetical protein